MDPLARYRNSRVLVFWSGGVDSTALVAGLVQAGAWVTILTVESDQLPNTAAETKHRKLLLDWFKEQRIEHRGHISFKLGSIYGTFCASYPQSWWWVNIAQLYRNNDYDYIALGWVVADDSVAFIPEYLNYWNAGSCFMQGSGGPQLVFPFAKFTKSQIVNNYFKDFQKPPVWWCENPVEKEGVYSECGKCPSCLSAYEFGLFGKFDRKHPYFDGED